MTIRQWFQKLSDGRKANNPLEAGIQTLMAGLAPLYGTGTVFKRILHESNLLDHHELSVPVLSVGNLTLGGTGKTPFTMMLIEELKAMGRQPAIVVRGYGREDEDALVVVHDGRRLRSTVEEAGDEAVLMAKTLGNTPVIACSNRHRAGKLAIRKFHVDTIVLDDGFQHYRLARDGDFVLVDATQRLGKLKLFPRGTLREPASGLKRAHAAVLTRWNQAPRPQQSLMDIKRVAVGVPTVRTIIEPGPFLTLDNTVIEQERLIGKRVVLLCAVGNPSSVKKTLQTQGVKVVKVIAKQDHAALTAADLKAARQLKSRKKAEYVVITAKDAVKLSNTGPHEDIAICTIKLKFLQDDDRFRFLRIVKSRLEKRRIRGFLK